MCKMCRVSQGHLEIGLDEWRKIVGPYFTTRQPVVTLFSQLTDAELDDIITEMETVKRQQAEAPPPPGPEPVTVQATFW